MNQWFQFQNRRKARKACHSARIQHTRVMPQELRAFKIFIATPSGLENERKAFRDVVASYNESDANHRGVHFIPVGWEITLGGIGRPQALINEEIRKCDYFLLLLWDRWGSPPTVEGQGQYTSGTEEEYSVAWKCFADENKSMRQIVAFFKAVDTRQLSDPGEQLKKVLDFKRALENEKKILFDTFDEVSTFEKRLRCYLAQWVRDHEGGQTAKVINLPKSPQSPVSSFTVPNEASAKPISPNLEKLIDEAWKLADEGRLTDAEAKFAQAIIIGDPIAFIGYGRFLIRIGRLQQAEFIFGRLRELAHLRNDQDLEATAYGNLGLIFETLGDLNQAERMLLKSLEIYERLGDYERTATSYGNLALISNTRGDLAKAEQMTKKSLELYKQFDNQRGMASQYGNLGLIFRTRGDLAQAENMFRKSLEICERLGDQKCMANQYGNLGLIFDERGNLVQAEQMHRQSLEIDKRLGDQEGIIANYNNLGLIFQKRGDLIEAEKLFRNALEISTQLGNQSRMASQFGNLGLIFRTQGDLAKAEQMFHKSLEISERLGDQEGVAKSYGNLGLIFESQGKHTDAREVWTKSRDLFSKIHIPQMVKKIQGWLDNSERLNK